MSCATFTSVDVVSGNLIYWFLFEDTEPNTGYFFDNYCYGISVDEQHQIVAIHNEYKNDDGSDSLVDMGSVEGSAIMHAIQDNQRPGWIDVETIKLGVSYLYNILINSMGASVAESLFPGEEVVSIDIIETELDLNNHDDATNPISSNKIH